MMISPSELHILTDYQRMKKKHYKEPSKDKINEYKGYIEAIQEIADDMPDGAFIETMRTETERWLIDNGFHDIEPLDFYIQHANN